MSVKAIDYFDDFIRNISLTQESRDALKKAHTDLRTNLNNDKTLAPCLITTFIQGSYARSTGIKPAPGDNVDVDVIVVTNLSSSMSAHDAFEHFYPFMEDNYDTVSTKKDDTSTTVHQQSRSIGIELAKVDVDFVPTAAPSEAMSNAMQRFSGFKDFTVESLSADRESSAIFESAVAEDDSWKDEPLLIPDYDDNRWEETHPLEQIRKTREKNKNCNGHFLKVVKSIKWWKRVNLPNQKHPKSYPLERFVGECCPDNIGSVAEGIVLTFETIVNKHPNKPFLPDYGVPTHDVFGRLSVDDYDNFYNKVKELAPIARAAYDAADVPAAVKLWKQFFADCDEFPTYDGPDTDSAGVAFTPRTSKSTDVPTARFG